jgi:hypothetical protein
VFNVRAKLSAFIHAIIKTSPELASCAIAGISPASLNTNVCGSNCREIAGGVCAMIENLFASVLTRLMYGASDQRKTQEGAR